MINLFFAIFFLFFAVYGWKKGIKEDSKSSRFCWYAIAGLDFILGLVNFYTFFVL